MNSVTSENGNNPPHPRLVVRVGVTGHRPESMLHANKSTLIRHVESVLDTVEHVVNKVQAEEANIYSDASPILCVISPLAEGADRIVAQIGLDKNFELRCPLPFFREVYEMDFKGSGSVEEYYTLLERASAVLELDGSYETSEQRKEAYETVGRMVSKQSDLLIAIWDGKQSSGRGGTGQIVEESLERGLPVVWIDSESPHEIKLLGLRGIDTGKSPMTKLADDLNDILCLEAAHETILWQSYFSEKPIYWTLLGPFFTGFRNLLAHGKLGKLNVQTDGPIKIKKRQWDRDWDRIPDFPQNIKKEIEEIILPHQAWADYLACYYGDKYRGSFLIINILAGFAVFFALFAYALGWASVDHPSHHLEWVWTTVKIFIVLAILINIYRVTSGRWHLQWLTYRLLAERLRQMRYLTPLGLVLPLMRLPGHKKTDENQPRYSWGNRLFSAIVRETGLPTARIEPDYLSACWTLVKEVEIKGQIQYHVENAASYQRFSHHLRIIGHGLFLLTLLASVMHLIYHGPFAQWLVFITAVAPAFGAAVYGISSQGEFTRIANQSKAMSLQLENVLEDMNSMGDTLLTANLEKLFESVSEIMLSELIDWDFLYQEKSLTLNV